ncbi:hypothetical protein F2Q69_00061511 [Brassica cretica]|uniref:AP complex subunit sigma n=1 Tax=Brassica cretica TaxID=69181 RepID=A0A8S9RHF2_BRACR|nr:hypothetical protein F2Q69_00061511 [Brassica cretica]
MIKAVMMMNTQGKPRLAKLYDFLTVEKQQELIRGVFSVVLCSRPENVSNFLEIDSLFGPVIMEISFMMNAISTIFALFEATYSCLQSIEGFSACIQTLCHSLLCACFLMDQRMSFAVLDLIHVLVEILDKCFSNVCELFNYSKALMHTMLDEIVFGGQVLETSSTEVIKAVENISKLEAASNAISLVPKSVSGWRGR